MMVIVALFLSLAACGERPQRVMTEPESAEAPEANKADMRERTLRQGESARMGY
jgi:hypothetical protein